MKTFNAEQLSADDITQISRDIKAGAVCIIPTDTVYGLAACAFNPSAVKRIYELKNRPIDKPLPVLTGNMEHAEKIAVFDETARKLAGKFWRGALTLVLPLKQDMPFQKDTIGIRIPAHAKLLEILRTAEFLAATSANLSGNTAASAPAELEKLFKDKADYFIENGNLTGKESSVVSVNKGKVTILRQGQISEKDILSAL